MEYYNIIIFVLIFVFLLTCFYLVINNFGVNNKINNFTSDIDINSIERKILTLKSEINQIKNEIDNNNIISDLQQLNTNNIFPVTNVSTESNNTKQINMNNIVPLANISNESKINLITDTQQINNNLIPTVQQMNMNNNLMSDIQKINTNNLVPLANISTESNNDQKSSINIVIENEPNLNNLTQNLPNTCSNNSCSKPPPIIYDPIANYDIAKLTDPLVDPRGRTSADQIPTPQVAAQFNFPTQGVLDRYHRVGLLIAIEKNRLEMPFSEFSWNGPSKTNKNKKKKRYVSNESESSNKVYRGVQIKEGFDSDDYSDDYSDYSSDSIEEFESSKSVNNVYNIYNSNNNNILELIGKKITDNWYKYFTSISIGNKIIKVSIHNKNRRELYSGDIIYIPELKKEYRVKIDPMDMIEYNPYMF